MMNLFEFIIFFVEKTLKENGKLIYANYVKTIFCENNTVNDKHPYYIVCEWNNPQDGKKYMLKSKNIWWNPECIIYRKNIQTFPVYMDPNNSRKYIMDLDILKED